MKLYGAIDLHSNNNVTVLIDEQDKVVYEKRLPNDLGLITQQLEAYQSSLEGIVVESTYNWYWLVDGLMDKGHQIHLANTAAIQQYEGCALAGPHSTAGNFTRRLHLSQGGTSGARSAAQARPTGASENRQPIEHPKSNYAQYRKLDELEPDQDTPTPTG